MKKHTRILSAVCSLPLLAGVTGYAQTYTGITDALPVAVEMGGTTKYDGWYNLSSAEKTKVIHGESETIPGNTGYPTFFQANNPWPSPIDSQLNSNPSNAATLNKTANGAGGMTFAPFPSGDSIYFGGMGDVPNTFGGTLTVFEDNPVLDLGTIVFQVQIGETFTYDFYNGAGPQLTLNYGDSLSTTIEADISDLILAAYNGSVEMPTGPEGELQDEDIYINLYGFQWDVSDYEDITSFSIAFSGVEHAQLYALQLDQSSFDYGTTSMIPVPEPATWALMAGAGVLTLTLLLRRRRASLGG